jgi:hypothetical protein
LGTYVCTIKVKKDLMDIISSEKRKYVAYISDELSKENGHTPL